MEGRDKSSSQALGDAVRLVVPAGCRGGYYHRPSDQGREAELAEAWRRRGRPVDPPAVGVAGPSIG
jgi:hypothetical protein